MKKYLMLSILLTLIAPIVLGQPTSITFQGEISSEPFFLHLKIADNTVSGFYKYQIDSVTIPLKGTMDDSGDVKLTGVRKAYPIFQGQLQGRLIKGQFTPSIKANPQTFYGVNLRGEYGTECYDYMRIVLFSEGYMMNNNTDPILLKTHMQADSLYLYADSVRFYMEGDNLQIISNKIPWLIHQSKGCEELLRIFTPIDEFLDGESFIEFPEKDEEKSPENKEVRLNESYAVRLRPIPQSEYVVKQWESTQLRSKPYKAITDIDEVYKLLGNKLKVIEQKEEDYTYTEYEITFKDGAKKRLDTDYYFDAYYPEVEVLYFIGGHESDQPFDLNDSKKEHVGVPSYYCLSPDKQLRISGYHDGQDCVVRFLESWNKSKKSYEFISYLGSGFCYADGLFWVSNSKFLFRSFGGYTEMEIIKVNKDTRL